MNHEQTAYSLYPKIGMGRATFAYSLADHADRLQRQIEPTDILHTYETDLIGHISAQIYKLGYFSLSYAPHQIYHFVRSLQSKQENTRFMDTEFIQTLHNSRATIISVSPNSSAAIGQAGREMGQTIDHFAVVGDVNITQPYIQLGLRKLFVFDNSEQYINHLQIPDNMPFDPKTDIIKLNGMILPPSFLSYNDNLNRQDRRNRLVNGNPIVGIATHGAGDIGTIRSLVELQGLIKNGQIHASFYVGKHKLMKYTIEKLAQYLDIPVTQNLNQLGEISIIYGDSTQEAVQKRAEAFPQYTLLISPTANENLAASATMLVRGYRNSMEKANLQYGEQVGFVRRIDPKRNLLEQIKHLLGQNGQGQQMENIFHDNISVDAGQQVVQCIYNI